MSSERRLTPAISRLFPRLAARQPVNTVTETNARPAITGPKCWQIFTCRCVRCVARRSAGPRVFCPRRTTATTAGRRTHASGEVALAAVGRVCLRSGPILHTSWFHISPIGDRPAWERKSHVSRGVIVATFAWRRRRAVASCWKNDAAQGHGPAITDRIPSILGRNYTRRPVV